MVNEIVTYVLTHNAVWSKRGDYSKFVDVINAGIDNATLLITKVRKK